MRARPRRIPGTPSSKDAYGKRLEKKLLGYPAFGAMLGIYWLMVFKPA